MALRDGIVGAWLPTKTNSGLQHFDRSGFGTHLRWVSPPAGNWESSVDSWIPRTKAGSDYLVASRAVPVYVKQWSVVHWTKLYSLNTAIYPNSMDANFGVGGNNAGPRIEYGSTTTSWIYSSGVSSIILTGQVAGNTVPIGTWACYAMTHDGVSASRGYSQGRVWPGGQTNYGGSTGSFIGRFSAMNLGRGYDASRRIDALIGGTVLFSRQLTDAEMWQIWQAGPNCEWVYPKRRKVFTLVPPAFKAAWARQRAGLIGGGVR